MSTHPSRKNSAQGQTVTQQSNPDWADRNPELRRLYLKAEADLEKALAGGDSTKARKARSAMDSVGREFVEINRGLIVSQARRFNRNTIDDKDNLRAAELGLWEAFLRFDPDRGVAFSTFSRQHIAGGVQRTVRRNEFQHLSQSEFNLRKQIRLAQSQLAARFGRHPSDEELAEHCGIPLSKIEKVLAPAISSLDSVIGEDGFTLGDTLESAIDESDPEKSVEAFLEALTDLELWVILQRGGFFGTAGISLVEAADGIGIGREVARRAETRARVRIGATLLADKLGRLAEPDEIGDLLQVDTKHVTEYHNASYEEIRSRWIRCSENVLYATSDRERRLAQSRLDRCGEEFMLLASKSIFEVSGRYIDDAGTPLGLNEGTRQVWEAFRSWDPSTSTFPSHMRNHLSQRFRRSRTVAPVRTLPEDELWYMVRDCRMSA